MNQGKESFKTNGAHVAPLAFDKLCRTCKEAKPSTSFSVCKSSHDGLQFKCRACHSAYNKATKTERAANAKKYYIENRAFILSKSAEWLANNKEKKQETSKIWRDATSDKIKEKSRLYSLNNKNKVSEKSKRWRKANPVRDLSNRKKWRDENPDLRAANTRKYQINKLHATPAWANDFFMKEAYSLARLRSAMTGIKWHVDHIVPIRSKIVCGLHVENNLQVIPARTNMEKSNRYWANMP
jgi:hypothetical protein